MLLLKMTNGLGITLYCAILPSTLSHDIESENAWHESSPILSFVILYLGVPTWLGDLTWTRCYKEWLGARIREVFEGEMRSTTDPEQRLPTGWKHVGTSGWICGGAPCGCRRLCPWWFLSGRTTSPTFSRLTGFQTIKVKRKRGIQSSWTTIQPLKTKMQTI